MKLSERKRKILQCVVDDYITTAQPVSSKVITEKYLKGVSSATVRSELSGLEEMGYLTQPHTSSGRVPSIEAYRLYVNELMDKNKLSSKELNMIKTSFNEHAENLEEVVQNAVKVISELTDYTSVACAPHNGNEKILKIDLFRHKKDQALLIILTENTLIRDKFVSIPEQMTDAQIVEAAGIIEKLFIGKQLDEIMKIEKAVAEEFECYREIFESIMEAIENYVNEKPSVFLEGENKTLEHPEYNDTEKVKNFLSIVTSKERLSELLNKNDDDIEINIKIGGEENENMDCSVVTATYSSGGVNMGTYGVIGPMRMDYQKVVSVLEGVGKILEDIIKNKQ